MYADSVYNAALLLFIVHLTCLVRNGCKVGMKKEIAATESTLDNAVIKA